MIAKKNIVIICKQSIIFVVRENVDENLILIGKKWPQKLSTNDQSSCMLTIHFW